MKRRCPDTCYGCQRTKYLVSMYLCATCDGEVMSTLPADVRRERLLARLADMAAARKRARVSCP